MLERKAPPRAFLTKLERDPGRQQGLRWRHYWKGQRLHDIGVGSCGVGNFICRCRVYVEVQGRAMSYIDFDMGQQFRVISVVGGSQPRQPT